MLRFQNKVVWVTGASAGLGRGMALVFAREGGRVAVSGRRQDRLNELVAEIEAAGGVATAIPCDVSDDESVASAVSEVVSRFGRLDVAVANAGFGVGGRFETIGIDDWRRQLDVNVLGLVSTARHALPHLTRSRGRLALIGSVAGIIPGPGSAPYAASKAAVQSIGQTLSVELHGSGVTCTTILPGFVESEIGQVDNQGAFRSDWTDRRPRGIMWPTARAAEVMVTAIEKRKREYVFTIHGRLGALFGRHAPGLIHLLMVRFARISPPRGG